MLETPCCLATFWRISRRLSLGSERRRVQNCRVTVILNNVTHSATVISGSYIRMGKTGLQLQNQASLSVKEERVLNTNSPFLLANQISLGIGEGRKDGVRPSRLSTRTHLLFHCLNSGITTQETLCSQSTIWMGHDFILGINAAQGIL